MSGNFVGKNAKSTFFQLLKLKKAWVVVFLPKSEIWSDIKVIISATRFVYKNMETLKTHLTSLQTLIMKVMAMKYKH